tara:strand:- start:212 stop:505 length:294 start_codon:yes stop_codon:yes gene_type:complete
MSNNHYKVFFTISFLYQIDSKKKISKSFKSDIDLDHDILNSKINDKNIHSKWEKFALNAMLNDLNPPSKFDDKLAFEKKIVIHRIVNLMNLTEVYRV